MARSGSSFWCSQGVRVYLSAFLCDIDGTIYLSPLRRGISTMDCLDSASHYRVRLVESSSWRKSTELCAWADIGRWTLFLQSVFSRARGWAGGFTDPLSLRCGSLAPFAESGLAVILLLRGRN